jgi:tRNA (cytidine32/uridine32-2'-O)-methyltransferase
MITVYSLSALPHYGGACLCRNCWSHSPRLNNFCFTDLRIVGSVPEKNDFYLAMHSEHILENASLFPNLESAIQGLDRVIAFSRRLGKNKPIDLSPRQMARYVHSLPQAKIGIVFGRETFGLTDLEADLCPLRCHIPANPEFPSLNLAQAVALACWEIFDLPLDEETGKSRNYHAVDGMNLTKSVNTLLEVMHATGFFKKPHESNQTGRCFWPSY